MLYLLQTSGRDLMPVSRHKIPPLFFSRRDTHRYNVPSKYIRKILQDLDNPINLLSFSPHINHGRIVLETPPILSSTRVEGLSYL